MTDAPRCRYNLDSRCPTDDLRDRTAALEVAARGYRERAERAEALLASHARPVAACETAEGLRTPTEGAPAANGSESIVSVAHYGRTA